MELGELKDHLVGILVENSEFERACLAMPAMNADNREELFGQLCDNFKVIYNYACRRIRADCSIGITRSRIQLKNITSLHYTRKRDLEYSIHHEIDELKERIMRRKTGRKRKTGRIEADERRLAVLESRVEIKELERKHAEQASVLESGIERMDCLRQKVVMQELPYNEIPLDLTIEICEEIYKPALARVGKKVAERSARRRRIARRGILAGAAVLLLFVGASAAYIAGRFVQKDGNIPKAEAVGSPGNGNDTEKVIATKLPPEYENIIQKTPVLWTTYAVTKEFEDAPFDELELKQGIHPVSCLADNVLFLNRGQTEFFPLVNRPKSYFDGIPDVIYSPGVSIGPMNMDDSHTRQSIENAFKSWNQQKYYYDVALDEKGVAWFRAMQKMLVPQMHWMLELRANEKLEGLTDIVYIVRGKEHRQVFGQKLVLNVGAAYPDSVHFSAKYGEVNIDADIPLRFETPSKKK